MDLKCRSFSYSKLNRGHNRDPYFSNKYDTGDSKILLIQNEEIINESAEVANLFNSYFESVTESLNLFSWATESYNQEKDSVKRIVQRFYHHPSIIKIKQNIKILKKFFHTCNS